MNAKQCAGITRSGGRCTAIVGGAQEYCYRHDPAYAEQRSQAASKAAKSKHQDSDIGQVKARLKELAEGVIAGTYSRADASVAGQLYGIFIRAVEQERKQKETEELEERIQAIEEAQERRTNSWGA
jgi:hypothetical protein